MTAEPNPAELRQARRKRPGATSREEGLLQDPVIAPADQTPPSHYQLLGIRRGATRLDVVKGYQHALRHAQTDQRRKELVEAFRELGAQPLRTFCPYGHEIALYALDGNSHTVYCRRCDESDKPSSYYHYIGWATCVAVKRLPSQESEITDFLPHGAEPFPQTEVSIQYKTPDGDRLIQFVMDAEAPFYLYPEDFFSVIYREGVPWTLLNHTIARSFSLDPYRRYRGELDRMRERAEFQPVTRTKIA